MIVVVCVLLGLTLRLAAGRGFAELGEARLRGEFFLLALLVAQIAAPSLHLTGPFARAAYWVWLSTFPAMAVIAWFNRRQPGMAVLGVGLVLNFAVIAANGGMPVFSAAAAAVRGSLAPVVISAGDFVHVVGDAATRLPWLADALPLPGPTWLRALASPGDILLFVGIVGFVGLATGAGAGYSPRATSRNTGAHVEE